MKRRVLSQITIMQRFALLAAVLACHAAATCASPVAPSAPAPASAPTVPSEAHARANARDIKIDGTGIYPESVTASANGTVYAGSLGGTIYRAKPGARAAEPW